MRYYKCKKCGWEGEVSGRLMCLRCNLERTRQWRKDNPQKAKELKRRMDRKWRKEHREAYNARRRHNDSAERQAKYRQVRTEWLLQGDVTRQQLIKCFEEHNGKCAYCGIEIKKPRFTPLDHRGFDHIIPRAKGGEHTISNIVVCCRRCNELKGDNDVKHNTIALESSKGNERLYDW